MQVYLALDHLLYQATKLLVSSADADGFLYLEQTTVLQLEIIEPHTEATDAVI